MHVWFFCAVVLEFLAAAMLLLRHRRVCWCGAAALLLGPDAAQESCLFHSLRVPTTKSRCGYIVLCKNIVETRAHLTATAAAILDKKGLWHSSQVGPYSTNRPAI